MTDLHNRTQRTFYLPAVGYTLACLLICFITSGCGFIEIAPFHDGSYLTYTATDLYGNTSQHTLRFKNASRNLLEVVIEHQQNRKELPQPDFYDYEEVEEMINDPQSAQLPQKQILPDKNDKILVSRFLKQKGGVRLCFDEYGPLWLPKKLLKPGKKLTIEHFHDNAAVTAIAQWKEWQVFVVTLNDDGRAIKGTWYYSTKTGILVGGEFETGALESLGTTTKAGMVLTETSFSDL